MADFRTGEQVIHPKFGRGTVLEQESAEVVTVAFGSIGKKRLSIRHAYLSRSVEEHNDDMVPGGERYQEWYDSTFAFEEVEVGHPMGSHWDPFVESAEEILKCLPVIIPQASMQSSYASTYPPLREHPPHWPRAFNLVWPLRDHGLSLTLTVGHDANHLVSIYPFLSVGSQHELTLEKVHVWASGAEAQLECSWDAAELTFFDTQYAANRLCYEAGNHYQFILAGIAYECVRAEDQVWEAWNPRQSEKFQELAPEWAAILPDSATMPIHTRGMAGMLPCKDYDRDEYYFRGPIKTVEELTMLDQSGWKVRATVLRGLDNGDLEMDLAIVVTRKVWGDTLPPQVGDDLEGILWLQGYLWCL